LNFDPPDLHLPNSWVYWHKPLALSPDNNFFKCFKHLNPIKGTWQENSGQSVGKEMNLEQRYCCKGELEAEAEAVERKVATGAEGLE
jgi:hypothetical protein